MSEVELTRGKTTITALTSNSDNILRTVTTQKYERNGKVWRNFEVQGQTGVSRRSAGLPKGGPRSDGLVICAADAPDNGIEGFGDIMRQAFKEAIGDHQGVHGIRYVDSDGTILTEEEKNAKYAEEAAQAEQAAKRNKGKKKAQTW